MLHIELNELYHTKRSMSLSVSFTSIDLVCTFANFVHLFKIHEREISSKCSIFITTTIWQQGMPIDSNIMHDHFNFTIFGQNWTSYFKFGCLNLDNMYVCIKSSLTSPTTKNNSAFFISSRNLKKDSFMYIVTT